MKELNALGIGPKIGRAALPCFIISLVLSFLYKDIFCFGVTWDRPLLFAGIALLIVGLGFYIVTAKLLLKGLKTNALMTTGTFYLCRNPLYFTMIFLIFPGISFVIHSWLILTTSLVAYIFFKIYIKSEYREMESIFGEVYLNYRKNTPEIIPFPFKKWFKIG